MAFSSTLVRRTSRLEIYEVIETLDADIGGDVAHTLGRIPDKVTLTRIHAAAILSDYVATARTAAVVTLVSTAAVGSGQALAQLLVILEIADDLVR